MLFILSSDSNQLFLLLAFVLLLIIAGLIYLFKGRKKQITHNYEHGSARWSTREELIEALGGNKKGLWIGAGYRYSGEGHLICCAPPRAGKGASIIIPNLLIQPSGSYLVTDPKGELACITARAQKEHGQRVIILDPWEVQKEVHAQHGIKTSGFNPFAFLRLNMDKLLEYSEMLAEFLIPENPNTSEPFWDQRARSLIKLLLVHIMTALPKEEQTFWKLYKYLRTSTSQFAELLIEMSYNNAFDGYIQSGAHELMSTIRAEKAWGSILLIAQNGTSVFESPELRKSLDSSNFNPQWLTDGQTTVYIVIPEKYSFTHAAWAKIVLGLCLKAVNYKPDKKVIFLIDEAGNLGRMNEIIDYGYALGAGQNIQMWTFFQSLTQINDIYGENKMNGLLDMSAVRQFFNQQSLFSQQYVSNMLGNTTIIQEKTSASKDSINYSYTPVARPLLTPEEVGKEQRIITFVDNVKTRLPNQYYYRDYKDEWYEYFKQKADPRPKTGTET